MATLNLRSGTPEQPALIVGGTYDNLWGDGEHDCVVEDAVIDSPPPGQKPQIFGCWNITFRRCTFRGIRASAEQSHVEGIHINGCSNVRFEEVYWEDNDVFHAFITQWGGYAAPSDISFIRNRFGDMGPAGGYYSVKVRDEGGVPTPPVPGLAYEDSERKGPDVWPNDVPGTPVVQVDEWTPWTDEPVDPEEPIDPEPQPPTDLEDAVEKLRNAVALLFTLTYANTQVLKGLVAGAELMAQADDPRR